MKNILKLALAAVVLGCSWGIARAACAPTDMFCYASGPYTNQTQIGKLDASGNLTVNGGITSTGTTAITGSQTVSGNSTVSGKTIYPAQSVTNISSTTIITPTATYLTIVSSGANVTCGLGLGNGSASAPCISTSTATNGQWVVIASSSSVATITFSEGGTSGMALGAATRLIDNDNTLTLIYDSTASVWKEVAFGNN